MYSQNTDWIYSFIQMMMASMIPLLMVGLAGMFSEKGGISNIALDGTMIIGAFVGVFVANRLCVAYGVPLLEVNKASSYITGFWPRAIIYLVSMLAAGLTGLLFSLLLSFAANRLKSDQIIIGTAMNIFAPALCLFLAFVLNLSGKQDVYKLNVDTMLFLIPNIPGLGDIPYVGRALFQAVYPSFFIGILLLIGSAVVLNKTRFGLRLRACGENPYSAAAAGISVYRYRYIGTGISGVIGGMAGLVYATSFLTEFDGDVGGFGFLGLALMIFGNWKPLTIGLAALIFSFFRTLGSGYTLIPGSSEWNINSNIFFLIPFLATILVLILFSKRNRAPKYDGVPYFAERR
ncbi:MAG TPA: sugar ABC transporter permease [Firmicutes bacterium]|nr:sugar ABC transporter permease [Bacillota bacterium]